MGSKLVLDPVTCTKDSWAGLVVLDLVLVVRFIETHTHTHTHMLLTPSFIHSLFIVLYNLIINTSLFYHHILSHNYYNGLIFFFFFFFF